MMNSLKIKDRMDLYKFSKEELGRLTHLDAWRKSVDMLFEYLSNDLNDVITCELFLSILDNICVEDKLDCGEYVVSGISLILNSYNINLHIKFYVGSDGGMLLDEFNQEISDNLGTIYNYINNLKDNYVKDIKTIKSNIKINPRTKFIKLNYGSTTK